MATVKSATVKVMQSHNYCHFEASMIIEREEGLSCKEIDEARISCQRLTDKAVDQYKKAKTFESNRAANSSERSQLERECGSIRAKPESEWSPLEKAKIKALEDHHFQSQFYDYDSDDEDYGF